MDDTSIILIILALIGRHLLGAVALALIAVVFIAYTHVRLRARYRTSPLSVALTTYSIAFLMTPFLSYMLMFDHCSELWTVFGWTLLFGFAWLASIIRLSRNNVSRLAGADLLASTAVTSLVLTVALLAGMIAPAFMFISQRMSSGGRLICY